MIRLNALSSSSALCSPILDVICKRTVIHINSVATIFNDRSEVKEGATCRWVFISHRNLFGEFIGPKTETGVYYYPQGATPMSIPARHVGRQPQGPDKLWLISWALLQIASADGSTSSPLHELFLAHHVRGPLLQ